MSGEVQPQPMLAKNSGAKMYDTNWSIVLRVSSRKWDESPIATRQRTSRKPRGCDPFRGRGAEERSTAQSSVRRPANWYAL